MRSWGAAWPMCCAGPSGPSRRAALDALCFPMAVAVDGTGHPVDSASPYREARKRVQDRNPHGEHPADVPAGRNPGPIDLGEDPDGDLDGYDGRR